MLTRRIIACLDVSAGRVVKGVQFVDLIDAGDPAELAMRHAAGGADEIVFLDITATHEKRAAASGRCAQSRRSDLHSVDCGRGHSDPARCHDGF